MIHGLGSSSDTARQDQQQRSIDPGDSALVLMLHVGNEATNVSSDDLSKLFYFKPLSKALRVD